MAAVRGIRRGAWLGAVLGCGAALLAGCATSTVGAGAPVVPSAAPSATVPCDARHGVDGAGGTSLLRHRHPGRAAARP